MCCLGFPYKFKVSLEMDKDGRKKEENFTSLSIACLRITQHHILYLKFLHVGEKDEEEAVSFKEMLASFPRDCNAAATIDEVSPHLCFICLLHLANEHGLRIQDNPDMDDLKIHLPRVSA